MSASLNTPQQDRFLTALRRSITTDTASNSFVGKAEANKFRDTGLPPSCWGFAVTLYQPGRERLMVVRVGQKTALDNVRSVLKQIPKHDRFGEFELNDWQRCRMQVDFIVDEPLATDLNTFSDSALPDAAPAIRFEMDREQIGMLGHTQVISAMPQLTQSTRFELGVDGLRIVKDGKRRYFLPGDAFVRSILGMKQLQRHIQRLFPGEELEQLTFYRFRSVSLVSGLNADGEQNGDAAWLPLYRGMPQRECSPITLAEAAQAGTRWIVNNQQADGRFTYYYDAAKDSLRDHEHPGRDPATNPYYNLLRHSGGGITLLLEEEFRRTVPAATPMPTLNRLTSERLQESITNSLDFFTAQLVPYQTESGDDAAYALYNQTAKLGGSGIGLFSLALFQRLYRDDRYAQAASQAARHLMHEVNPYGEFRYYHVYLDKRVEWPDNQKYFSFYYPGEAILVLSHYVQHVCRSAAERSRILQTLHVTLQFLLRRRPEAHRQHYQSLPADSWLMMGITDLWNIDEFQLNEYQQFVFDDADKMVSRMYTPANGLYPDYVGSFYYEYGDHPYPDGARAEGLLAAYQLAVMTGETERVSRYGDACRAVAVALLRLCNTPDSVYAAPNPKRAIGGIRFKLTRQWFRVDTIQHVASFYLKWLTTAGTTAVASDP